MRGLCKHYRKHPELEEFLHASARQRFRAQYLYHKNLIDETALFFVENTVACPIMRERYRDLYQRVKVE